MSDLGSIAAAALSGGASTEYYSCYCSGACKRAPDFRCPAAPTYVSRPAFNSSSPTIGWVCPRCNRVNAPSLLHCDCPAPFTIGSAIATTRGAT